MTYIVHNQKSFFRVSIWILLIQFVLIVSCVNSTPDITIHNDSSSKPKDTTQQEQINTVKLYIENSASMDGYINGGADLKNAIHSYISDINNSGLAHDISLNFINDKIIDMGSDITSFFKNLNSPSDFKKAGGKRSSTDIAVIIKKVLDSTKINDVSIIVSDFIFSPGKKDASRYLGEQQIIIKDLFAKRTTNLAVMFFKFNANFSGTYFNRTDAKTTLKDESRPFYMLVLGSKTALRQIRKSVPETKIKGNGLQVFVMESGFNADSVKLRPGSNKVIKKTKEHKFALNIKIPENLLLDDSYLNDTTNYKVSGGDFKLTVNKQKTKGWTHLFEFSSKKMTNANVSVKLMKKLPEWVETFNDDEGLDIKSAIDKTYGLKTIVSGIFEAYTNGNDYFMQLPEVEIKVKQ